MSIQESKAEKMLGIFFVVLGILLVVAIIPWQIAAVETEWYNAPRFFPYVISGLMILLGVLLSWSGAKKKNMEGQETYSISKNGLMSVVVTLLLICIYVGALHFIPYLPCTIVALGALMWFFGQRDLRKLIPIGGHSARHCLLRIHRAAQAETAVRREEPHLLWIYLH